MLGRQNWLIFAATSDFARALAALAGLADVALGLTVVKVMLESNKVSCDRRHTHNEGNKADVLSDHVKWALPLAIT